MTNPNLTSLKKRTSIDLILSGIIGIAGAVAGIIFLIKFGGGAPKQYLTNTGAEGNENRIEKNVGVNYTYRFWNPCLLGIGHCESIEPPTDKKSESSETKTGAKP